jgi:hypothetical protein
MKTENLLKRINTKVAVVAIPVVIILFPFGYSVVAALVSQVNAGPQPFLEKPDAKYESCVRETGYMRVHHMHLLKDIREEAVRHGIRGEIGLKDCRGCHTSRERFCDRCHNAVSLNLDCFGCHYYP